jgi:hypothetical protein
MNKIDKFFDINMVLMSLFSSLEILRDEKKIELIYEIDATIPKELRGDVEVLSRLLIEVLTFVFENSQKKEIVLFLLAPKDFLYEESISFEIRETGLSKEMIESFLETRLKKNLKLLEGEIIYENENPSDIHINIPFKLNELGQRRYYRLPDMVMLGKKVLLLCESKKVAHSIEKMFKYFLYDVTVGVDEYKKQGGDLSQYDILVIDNALATEGIESLVAKVQKNTSLKYVLLQDSNDVGDNNKYIKPAYLIKPVMQESIFELIISLFKNEIKNRSIKQNGRKAIIDMEKYINDGSKKRDTNSTEKSKVTPDSLKENNLHSIGEEEIQEAVLDTEEGEKNTKRVGMVYSKELEKFLDSFDHSDVYFRQIVNEKQTWQIKEFCIDLEKQAKTIGAQRMLSFADRVSLLFVYDKLDMLPTYVGKYHMELKKLIPEIKVHLNSL